MEFAAPTFTLQTVFSEDRLIEAWIKVRANKGCAGSDNQTLEDFGTDLLHNLQTLHRDLLAGALTPRPYLAVQIDKPSGGQRQLLIPTVRDRVAQTALALAMEPGLDVGFEPDSHGYRKGRSVDTALRQVQALRESGLGWVLETDIDGFFDHISHRVLGERLATVLGDDALHGLAVSWLAAPVAAGEGWPQGGKLTQGIAQGSPLSPLYANLLLDELDEALDGSGFDHVRYADDFVVLAPTQERADAALALAEQFMASLGLRLKPSKTRIVPPAEGFEFLGARVAPVDEAPLSTPSQTLIPAVQAGETLDANTIEGAQLLDEPELEPGAAQLRTLYITEPGLSLLKDGEQLHVRRREEVLLKLPLGTLDRVVVAGNALLSSALLLGLSHRGIDVFIDGTPAGQGLCIESTDGGLLDLLMDQIRLAADEARAVGFVRAVVRAKLSNQMTLLKRLQRTTPAAAIDTAVAAIAQALQSAEATSIDGWRGHEGVGAKAYWAAIASALPAVWGFTSRAHNPAPDRFNAMLSYTYALLADEVHSQVRRRGLSARLGLLHVPQQNRPSLVLDLMEEFRPTLADALCLELARSNGIGLADFEPGEDAAVPWQLSTPARKLLIERFAQRLAKPLTHPALSKSITWSRAIQWQVWHYARVVQGKDPAYRPLKLKG